VVILQQGGVMSVNLPDNHELGSAFQPKFDAQGLLSSVAVDATSGEVLMLAFMDAQALAKTRETGLAHFHSRSRGRLWLKGESSGHLLRVIEIRVDCDQDALVLLVQPEGPACHTGAVSCFYRRLDGEELVRIAN
jgi:phosphoribosyl-AMP cyclohydrolase